MQTFDGNHVSLRHTHRTRKALRELENLAGTIVPHTITAEAISPVGLGLGLFKVDVSVEAVQHTMGDLPLLKDTKLAMLSMNHGPAPELICERGHANCKICFPSGRPIAASLSTHPRR